jgi:hypothetical protein
MIEDLAGRMDALQHLDVDRWAPSCDTASRKTACCCCKAISAICSMRWPAHTLDRSRGLRCRGGAHCCRKACLSSHGPISLCARGPAAGTTCACTWNSCSGVVSVEPVPAVQGKVWSAPINGDSVLEVDFEPFNRHVPRLTETRSIGQGVLHAQSGIWRAAMFIRSEVGQAMLLNFLRMHAMEGQQLMLAPHIGEVTALRDPRCACRAAAARRQAPRRRGRQCAQAMGAAGIRVRLGRHGPAWQRDHEPAGRHPGGPVARSAGSLSRAHPDDLALADPVAARLFRPGRVLGRPDTGGQVVYILDQVRALEQEMRDDGDQGRHVEPQIVVVTRLLPKPTAPPATSRWKNQRHRDAWILRVPFRHPTAKSCAVDLALRDLALSGNICARRRARGAGAVRRPPGSDHRQLFRRQSGGESRCCRSAWA